MSDALLTPLLVLAGVLIKGLWDFVASKRATHVNARQVDVSEKDAFTRQFQAIIEGFTQSLAAAHLQAKSAEESAARAHARLDASERREVAMLDHLTAVEALVPHPPGPPPRPWSIR